MLGNVYQHKGTKNKYVVISVDSRHVQLKPVFHVDFNEGIRNEKRIVRKGTFDFIYQLVEEAKITSNPFQYIENR